MNEEFKQASRLLRQLNHVLSEETTSIKAREVSYQQKLLANFLLPNYKILNRWLEEHGVAVIVEVADKFSNQSDHENASWSAALAFILQIKIEIEKTIVWLTSVNHLLTRSLLSFLETGSIDYNTPIPANCN